MPNRVQVKKKTKAQGAQAVLPQGLHKKLTDYLDHKEILTRENLIAWEYRGRKIGYLSSFYPVLSLIAVLRNYSNKAGLWYRLWHWNTPYKAGETVFFPNLRRFWGAKWKDFWSGHSDVESLQIRQRNLGYALQLILHLDAISAGKTMHISFAQTVFEQIEIKKARREYDGYYRLLTELFREINQPVQPVSIKYLQRKQQYLDYLAENTCLDDFDRGKNYEYRDPKGNIEFSPTRIWQALKKPDAPASLTDAEIIRPKKAFQHTNNDKIVPLTKYARLLDKWMFLDLRKSRFAEHAIKGCDAQGRLVGKDNRPLADAWYQYVVMKGEPPVIRYYVCGQRADGLPFALQDPQRKAGVTEQGYAIQSPDEFRLPYRKFVTHTEIAGDGLNQDEEVFVQGGGTFMIKNGRLRVLDSSSGHYFLSNYLLPEPEPDLHRALKFTHDVFEYYGADTSETILIHWEPYFGVYRFF